MRIAPFCFSGSKRGSATFVDQIPGGFGEHGFEKTAAEVVALEAQLGIGDLAAFTP